MPASRGLTEAFAERLLAVPAQVPPAVEHHVRRLLVDYFAGVVPSSATAVSRAAAEHVRRHYAAGPATAIGFGGFSPLGAAFLNGTSAHGLEVDDGYTPGSVHPGSVSFPPVLAAAEAIGADRDAVVRACAIALEVTCRLAAAGHPATWRNHFHNTPLTGVMAGAAAVAVLGGAGPDELRDALGIAASHAGGLFAFLGQSAEVKRVHPGKAARDAIASAELAQLGVTGPRSVLESAHGYIDAFARGDFDEDVLLDGLGTRWVMLDTYVKPYPSCRHLHGPIDAVRALVRRHGIAPGDVDRVRVGTYAVAAHHANTEVESFLDAQMSIPFAVATALVHPEVGLREFDDAARRDADVVRVTRATSVAVDAELDAAYPATRPARVELVLTDGRTVSELVEQPYGEPSNPVTDDDMTAKFVRLTQSRLGPRTREIAEKLWAFEGIGVVADVQAAIEEETADAAVDEEER